MRLSEELTKLYDHRPFREHSNATFWAFQNWAAMIEERLSHMEEQATQQPETETSEPSSALSRGPAMKPSRSLTASRDTSREQLVLTDETTGSSRSISCTSDEWEVIRRLCLMQEQTSVSPTTFGENRAGDRGVAARESKESLS